MSLPACILSVLLLVVCCQPVIAQAGMQKPALTKNEVAAILKAAENGDADAQDNLGFLYEFGHGVPQDDAQAAFWWRRAAEQGNRMNEV